MTTKLNNLPNGIKIAGAVSMVLIATPHIGTFIGWVAGLLQ